MSKEDDKRQTVYKQLAMILNYKPKIEHQHIHMADQTVDDVEDADVVEEIRGDNNSEKKTANDIIFPQSSLDDIFHIALNISKVKDGINRIIIAKGKEGKFLLSVKWWFVVHKVLEEIDWLNDKQDTKFIKWIGSVCHGHIKRNREGMWRFYCDSFKYSEWQKECQSGHKK